MTQFPSLPPEKKVNEKVIRTGDHKRVTSRPPDTHMIQITEKNTGRWRTCEACKRRARAHGGRAMEYRSTREPCDDTWDAYHGAQEHIGRVTGPSRTGGV